MITLWHWHTEPLLVGSLCLVGWLYALCIGPWRELIQIDCPYPLREALYFYAGLLSFYAAVGSPLDALGENFLLSAHMVQHHLLQYLTPPLLVLGTPGWLVDAVIRPRPLLGRFFRFMVHPLAGGSLFTVFFIGWHFPQLYEAALTNKALHILQHLTMFAPSLLLWWAFLSPSEEVPPLSYGAQILYAFLLSVTQVPLFFYLVFSDTVHYPTYEFAPRILALTPLEDQVLSGVIMKITGMFVSLGLLAYAFFRWYQATEARSRILRSHPEIVP